MIKMVQAIQEEEDDYSSFPLKEQTQSLINQVFRPLSQAQIGVGFTANNKNTVKTSKQPAYSSKKYSYYQQLAGKAKRKENFSLSFQQFLLRTQEGIKKKENWLMRQKTKKEEELMKTLRKIPQILRGSRERLEPLYERCVALQKSKEKKLKSQRVDKEMAEIKKAESYSYHPKTNRKIKPRSFEEYLAEKDIWNKKREDQLNRKKLQLEAMQFSECTFTPNCLIGIQKNKISGKHSSGYAKTLESLQNSFQNSEENASLWD